MTAPYHEPESRAQGYKILRAPSRPDDEPGLLKSLYCILKKLPNTILKLAQEFARGEIRVKIANAKRIESTTRIDEGKAKRESDQELRIVEAAKTADAVNVIVGRSARERRDLLEVANEVAAEFGMRNPKMLADLAYLQKTRLIEGDLAKSVELLAQEVEYLALKRNSSISFYLPGDEPNFLPP